VVKFQWDKDKILKAKSLQQKITKLYNIHFSKNYQASNFQNHLFAKSK